MDTAARAKTRHPIHGPQPGGLRTTGRIPQLWQVPVIEGRRSGRHRRTKILKYIKIETQSLLVSKNKHIIIIITTATTKLNGRLRVTESGADHVPRGIQFCRGALIASLYMLPIALILDSESFSELSKFDHFKN